MALFRKRNKEPGIPSLLPLNPAERLRKFFRSDAELLRIAGPEDGGCVCGDWVGAVVSVTGKSEDWPALMEAVEDGVFHPDCRHRLEAYLPERHEAEALFCTKLAVAARDRRREAEGDPGETAAANPVASGPSAEQMEFETLYAAARRAEAEGAPDSALAKCEAALDVLRTHNLYGEQQINVERALEARIRTLKQR